MASEFRPNLAEYFSEKDSRISPTKINRTALRFTGYQDRPRLWTEPPPLQCCDTFLVPIGCIRRPMLEPSRFTEPGAQTPQPHPKVAEPIRDRDL